MNAGRVVTRAHEFNRSFPASRHAVWRFRLRLRCEERAGVCLRTYGGLQQSTGLEKLHLEHLSMAHLEREEQYTCCDSRRFARKLKQEGTIQ